MESADLGARKTEKIVSAFQDMLEKHLLVNEWLIASLRSSDQPSDTNPLSDTLASQDQTSQTAGFQLRPFACGGVSGEAPPPEFANILSRIRPVTDLLNFARSLP